MKLRVVRCPEDAHDLPWVFADDCEHWPRKCPSKYKNHNFKRNPPGFDVIAIPIEQDYPDYFIGPNLEHPKRYLGGWYDTPNPDPHVYHKEIDGNMSFFHPAGLGYYVYCTHCDLEGSISDRKG